MLIQDYNPVWANQFKQIKSLLQAALDHLEVNIEHVGSTAVSGLAAKPIIDIDIIYDTETNLAVIEQRLATIGYEHHGDQGIPKREVFKRGALAGNHPILDAVKHHLYACPIDSKELQRHLLFRDFLRENLWARQAYQQLKIQLAQEVAQDKKAYAALKEIRATAFVESIIDEARK